MRRYNPTVVRVGRGRRDGTPDRRRGKGIKGNGKEGRERRGVRGGEVAREGEEGMGKADRKEVVGKQGRMAPPNPYFWIRLCYKSNFCGASVR